jgi:arylsulfatase A-like enzyme/outer membrane protein assembly factor BamB
MADDWSWPHAGILGDPVVETPHFDRIASQGVLFENAFVSTPSCTPSRLSILTGQHHWRLQEGASLGGSLRKEFAVYTDLLAEGGYRVGRFGKGVWPSKHTFRQRDSFGEKYRSFDAFLTEREAGEPFCYWHGGQHPHRPYELGIGVKSGIQLSQITVPACMPDNETVRSDVADYLWEVQRFDSQVGEIVERLTAMDELENTILVVSGDNGMPFPRCKATLYDQGTRVPLAIRWGNRVQVAGRKSTSFVSLCDLAPTFLEAAGLTPPEAMTGRSLLPLLDAKHESSVGSQWTSVLTGMEKHVYLYPSRALRNKDFLYIRNFKPETWPTGAVEGHNPRYDFAEEAWPTEKGAFSFNIDPSPSKQFLRLHRNEAETASFAKLAFLRHPTEELYDLQDDPDQLRNVAGDKAYAKQLTQLRRQLTAELIQSSDPRVAVKGYEDRNIEGWAVRTNQQLLADQADDTNLALDRIEQQLRTISQLLGGEVLVQLRSVPIWLSPQYEGVRPTAEYHPNEDWLRKNGRRPELTQCVELSNIKIFDRECRRMPMMILHELAHAYHDQVLGFGHPEVKLAFDRAKQSGIYDSVRRNNGKDERAYGMTNHKEFFAESTEAFFGINDFYPVTREQLWKHDPRTLELLAKLWQRPPTRVSVEWAQYRGFQGSGVASHSPTSTQWNVDDGTNILWQTEIPGLAHSAPIIWGDRIYVTTAVAEEAADLDITRTGAVKSAPDDGVQQWRLLAIDKSTGKVIFDKLGHQGEAVVKRHPKSSHCNSTPATDGEHIVALFGSAGLFCFDMKGDLEWHKDLGPMDSGYYRDASAQWGFASSPVIYDGKVVVQCDVQECPFLAVFDIHDGSEIWRVPRPDVTTWSSPTIVQQEGRPQILINGYRQSGAYDFASGDTLWKLKGGGDIPVPTPIVAHGYAYLTSSHGSHRPVRAIRLDAQGDITPPGQDDSNRNLVWTHSKLGSYMQTPIIVGQHLFAANGGGILKCFDAVTGEVIYKQRMPGGGFTASPVSDSEHVYFPSESGSVNVVAADGSGTIVGTHELGDNCLATPAISTGILFFRTEHQLIAIAGDAPVAKPDSDSDDDSDKSAGTR